MTVSKKIAIASDHAGPELKASIILELQKLGYEPINFGVDDTTSVDYPDYAEKVIKSITSGEAENGILICGSGIGMSIAANRNKNIRAALCHNEEIARLSRMHNDSNVLVLGARFINQITALHCIKIFLSTKFEGGRHKNRIIKISSNKTL